MRPLYQERILPNLAYVGGGGELAYWLERKLQFNEAKISYPILIRRNSIGILSAKNYKQWQAFDLDFTSFVKPIHQLEKSYIKDNYEMPYSLTKAKEQFESLFQELHEEINSIDPSLAKAILAEAKKSNNGLSMIEAKLLKHFKGKNQVDLMRMQKVYDFLFPDNSLQERKVNFLQFYINYEGDFLDDLMKYLNPLEKDFQIMVLD